MSRYILTPPPNDEAKFREPYLFCWAAGLAAHLNVTGLGNVGWGDIVLQTAEYQNSDGTIPETGGAPDDHEGKAGGLGAVYSLYGVYSKNIPCSSFTYDYVLNVLQKKGHLIIMYQYGGVGMGHTQVVYGIGVPDDGYVSVFDPMTSNPAYANLPIAGISGSGTNMYVGWAAWAGP